MMSSSRMRMDESGQELIALVGYRYLLCTLSICMCLGLDLLCTIF